MPAKKQAARATPAQPPGAAAGFAPAMPPEDIQRLVRELQIHQAELEMQNEELRIARAELADSRNRYHHLYDFAPIGCMTLDDEGVILEANLTLATMLGADRLQIIGKPFSRHVDRDWQDTFYLHWQAMRGLEARRACDLRLRRADGHVVVARLESRGVRDHASGRWRYLCALSDIFEQSQAEDALRVETAARAAASAALRESERILRMASDHARVGLVRVDRNGRYTFANPAFSEMVGVRADVVGLRVADVLGPELDRQISPHLARALAGERASAETTWPASVDGRTQPRHAAVTWEPERDASGEVVGATVVIVDITERKLAEQTLRESEARLRKAAELAGMTYVDLDYVGDRAIVSENYRQIVGFDLFDTPSAAGNIARRMRLARDHIVPEDRARFEAEYDSTVGQASRRIIYRVRGDDGAERWIASEWANEYGPDGELSRVFVAHLDITERKRIEMAMDQSKTQLEVALAASSMGTWVYDFENDLVISDSRVRTIYGLGDEAATREAFTRLIVADDRARHLDVVRAALDPNAAGLFQDEFRIHRQNDGEERWIAASGSIWPSDRPTTRLVGTVADITERKRAEEELARTQRLEMAGKLAGGVAHDFNNLLAVIAGNLELVEPGIADAKVRLVIRETLQAIETGATFNRRVQRMLSLGRPRAEKPKPVVLSSQIPETVKLIERLLGETFTLAAEYPADLWPALVDTGEIDSALFNLVLNARDAMPTGGGLAIKVGNATLDAGAAELDPDARPGDYVRLSVVDTGTGMAPDVLRRAKDPFFTTKPAGKGSGLGLSSVFNFVRQSGGFATLASEVGAGTTVHLYFPRAGGKPASARAARQTPMPLGDGELILVVDDNDQLRANTLDRLESIGYSVLGARSGAKAVAMLLSGEPIALVLSDIGMPGAMSGHDLAQWTLSNKPHIKVLLTTGYIPGDVRRRKGGATFARFRTLNKPYTRETLARAVHDALNRSPTPQAGSTEPVKT